MLKIKNPLLIKADATVAFRIYASLNVLDVALTNLRNEIEALAAGCDESEFCCMRYASKQHDVELVDAIKKWMRAVEAAAESAEADHEREAIEEIEAEEANQVAMRDAVLDQIERGKRTELPF